MRKVRDNEARGSVPFFELCQTPSFGSCEPDTNMSEEALALRHNYPATDRAHTQLDKQIYTRLLLLSAETSLEYFRSVLTQLFPDANVEDGEHSTPARTDDAGKLSIIFAKVKGLERVLVKFDEYVSTQEGWPVTPLIRDTLRAKIEAPTGDAFANVANMIISTFDVREGHGRLKNNLTTTRHQPPNLLINVVIVPPGQTPITAEIQIYLGGIQVLLEHRYYEAR